MKHVFEGPASSDPRWKTPIVEFYDRTLYNPPWLFYFEIAVTVAILVLMWKYRPLRVQKKMMRPLTKRTLARKVSAQAAKPPSAWSKKR